MPAMTEATPFPFWVVRKIGEPLLLEADWNYTFPNAKFALFASSSGTLARETSNLLVGGAGSVKMLTAATSNDATELKYSHHYIQPKGWFLALEMKWTQQFASGGTNMQIGIENRDASNIKHVRFRWTPTTSKWMYEDNALVYQDFPASIGGPLVTEKPNVSTTSGSKWGWARCVIDPFNNRYVGFEASGLTGIETRDMRTMNLPCSVEGVASAYELLFFTLVQAGAALAEPGYTTDWCISVIPPTVDPFSPED